jgi:hypothetical protein
MEGRGGGEAQGVADPQKVTKENNAQRAEIWSPCSQRSFELDLCSISTDAKARK